MLNRLWKVKCNTTVIPDHGELEKSNVQNIKLHLEYGECTFVKRDGRKHQKAWKFRKMLNDKSIRIETEKKEP